MTDITQKSCRWSNDFGEYCGKVFFSNDDEMTFCADHLKEIIPAKEFFVSQCAIRLMQLAGLDVEDVIDRFFIKVNKDVRDK